MAHEPTAQARGGLTVLQKAVLGLLSLALAGSIAVRALSRPAPAEATPAAAQGVTAASGPNASEEPGPLERFLPYLTEASLFGLLGFALGYATRKVAKLALIVLILGFVAVQGMVHAGWIEVDWGGLLRTSSDRLLDPEASAPVRGFLTDRLPAVGTLLFGWGVGFRRG